MVVLMLFLGRVGRAFVKIIRGGTGQSGLFFRARAGRGVRPWCGFYKIDAEDIGQMKEIYKMHKTPDTASQKCK